MSESHDNDLLERIVGRDDFDGTHEGFGNVEAKAAVEALGYRPTLGPMPETRWVKTREVSAV